jgi:hypothetical protein
MCGEAEKKTRLEPGTSEIRSTSGIHFATFDAVVLQVSECRTQHVYFIIVRSLQEYINRSHFFVFLLDELPDRLRCCLTILVDRLYIFCGVVIPKIILLLFAIICSSSWWTYIRRTGGYSFLWRREFLFFFYVLVSQLWQKGCHSSSRNFLFCGGKHFPHLARVGCNPPCQM